MPWQKFIIDVNPDTQEAMERAVIELGALLISLEDAGDEPILEPALGETPMWSNTRLIALFADDVDCAAVSQSVSSIGNQTPSWEKLDDREWERIWLDEFEPVLFGNRLWVCPHGQTPPSTIDATAVVYLDPGLAFGTGRHATTAMCLEWLATTELQGLQLLDYGCGSGILGLAAIALGAECIYAIDIDDQALIATGDNARANGMLDRFVIAKPGDYPSKAVDIVVANILAGPLISLTGTLAPAVQTGGSVVLSGILDEQADEVRLAYAPWFDMQQPTIRAGWAQLNGIRNNRVHTVS